MVVAITSATIAIVKYINALMVFFFNLPMRNYDVPEINCL